LCKSIGYMANKNIRKKTTLRRKAKKSGTTTQTPPTTSKPVSQNTQPTQPTITNPPPSNNVLFFVQNIKDGIEPNDVLRVEKQLNQIFAYNKLYLILYTAGGDVYSAVRIMKLLQDKFTEINVLIPDYAYSSGTIMSLASDKIFMGVNASLGPLDKPTEHFKDGSDMSSLDITKTLTNITSICTSMGISIYSQLRKENSLRLGKETASKIAFDTASKLVCPIIEQIDPFNLQRGFREATIGRDYAYNMLCTRMMKDNPNQAIKTSNSLVNDYPSHGFCIFREELKDVLKLNVAKLEDLPEWKIIKPRYDILKDDYSRYIKIEQI